MPRDIKNIFIEGISLVSKNNIPLILFLWNINYVIIDLCDSEYINNNSSHIPVLIYKVIKRK